jgi:hypothetical protein
MGPDTRRALRSLRRARRHLAAEGLLGAAVVSALPFFAERFGLVNGHAALPEIHVVYVLLLAGLVVAVVRLAMRLIAVLAMPCPSCGEAFHGDGDTLLWVRDLARPACAHCGVALAEAPARSQRAA